MAISSAKSESFSHEKRWVVVYPAYLDSKKSTKEGRKIPKLHAVEAPTSAEIHDVLAASGLNPLLERSKMYTRDADREPSSQGRVRVQLKNDDGTPKSLQYPTRAALYKFIAEMIPKLKSRQPGYVAPAAAASIAAGKKNKKKK